MSLQPKIDRITDILRRDDGISGAMHYTEQISWILFLKFLDDYEQNKYDEALLGGKKYQYVIPPQFRWPQWACPKNPDGSANLKAQQTGDDLKQFVNEQLFPFLKAFAQQQTNTRSLEYKIGSLFGFLDNRINSGHTLREVLDITDSLNFQSREELFELSLVYENLLKGMGSDGGNSGEFYTPRPLIKAIVQAINPQPGQTIYDPAAGSCGFLIEAWEQLRNYPNLSTAQLKKLHQDTFFGNEKTPLAYVMGLMNMILHGIESPNLYKQNSLTQNIRDIQEADRYHIVLANPPFGGKEKTQVLQNFSVQSTATELLFLQLILKSIRKGGQAAVVFPEGILFQTNNAFKQVKQQLLQDFNLHTILSLPPGVFLPYSGVKTNVLFFSRTGGTQQIWYYQLDPGYKLTKNKPLLFEHFAQFLDKYQHPPRRTSATPGGTDWYVDVHDIIDYDLSAKDPNAATDEDHLPPQQILSAIRANEATLGQVLAEIESLLNQPQQHR